MMQKEPSAVPGACRHRWGHTATLVKDGGVLIAGGVSFAGSVAPDMHASEGGTILHAGTYQLVSASNPAVAGEALEICGTGLVDRSVIPPQVAIAAGRLRFYFLARRPDSWV
jgi:hypothetical protein